MRRLPRRTDPVIIIGMHRSGTSLVARVLEDIGMLVGWNTQQDHEATFFLNANDWILDQAGASWDHPEHVDDLFEDARGLAMVQHHLRQRLLGMQSTEYLGWFRAVTTGFSWAPLRTWGWKDPRSTFTLPVWLELFPDAKVLHVSRNGVDVAQSLVQREVAIRASSAARLAKWRMLHYVRKRPPRLVSSARCLHLEGAFSLWMQYFDRASRAAQQAGERGLTVRYEDFVSSPMSEARRMARFIGASPEEELIRKAVSRIDAGRTNAFLKNPELVKVASERWAAHLEARGYYLEHANATTLSRTQS